MTFDDTRGKIKQGDIISISWTSSGEAYLQGYANRFPLKISGQHVGDVVITRDGTTITFNEKINNLDDVSGSVYFEVQGRNVTGTAEEDTKSVSVWSGTKGRTLLYTNRKQEQAVYFTIRQEICCQMT